MTAVVDYAPSGVELLAQQHYLGELALSGAVAAQVESIWQTIPGPLTMWGWYHEVADYLSDIVTVGQYDSVQATVDYFERYAVSDPFSPGETARIERDHFLSNTQMVQDRLGGVVRQYGEDVSHGVPELDARRRSQVLAQEVTTGLVRDAGREAGGTIAAADTDIIGYVRQVNLPSCPLCTLLAGRYYRWSDGFRVHEHCDCTHIPVYRGDDVTKLQQSLPDFRDAFDRGLVQGLSQKDAKAIELGADPSQVVNAKVAKMRHIELQGNRVRGTYSGITKRAGWGSGAGGSERQFEIEFENGHYRVPYDFRLTASECIRLSRGSQARAIDLLRKNGYLAE